MTPEQLFNFKQQALTCDKAGKVLADYYEEAGRPEEAKRLRRIDERLAQWERTVRAYVPLWEANWEPDWCLGEITKNTRLFLAGDHVIITPNNGGGERQPVYAVSGKGRHIERMFLQYRTSGFKRARHLPVSRFDHKGAKGGLSAESYEHDHGLLRFVEIPDQTSETSPSDPAVRQFVEARVRAVAVFGVSTNIPIVISHEIVGAS